MTLWETVRAGVRPGSLLLTPGHGEPVELTELFTRAEHTVDLVADAGVPVTRVEEVTSFPECLDGRVKTLHPHINRRNMDHDRARAGAPAQGGPVSVLKT